MTDYFDDYESSYAKDYSGSTSRAYNPNAGRAIDSFFGNLRTRDRKALPDYNALAKATGGAPRYSPFMPPVGRVSQASPTFQPAGPPQRYQVNMLGEAVGGLAGSAPGQAFLGTRGAQRGGVMDVNTGFGSFGLATAPVNMQNFATYAREAPIAAITSALGHNYQQPISDDPYAQPTGPVNDQNIFENMSELDFGNVLDNVIDGVGAVGNAIQAPFTWLNERHRVADAINRGRGIRDLARTGAAPGNWIGRITSLFDDTRFDWNKIAAAADAKGISQIGLAAALWDLHPDAVVAIFDNPDIDDAKLEEIVKGEPFSYNPGVNVLAELASNIAPILAGGGLVRGTGFIARGVGNLGRIGAGTAATVAGPALTARATTAAARVWVNLERAGLIGKPIATADYLGARTLVPAWRTIKNVGLGLEKANRYSLVAGTGIRLGEWSIKQTAELLGNDEAVAAMDRWLWEMPLSNNPGLMLVDGFLVHPIRTGKALVAGVKGGASVRLFGGENLSVSPVAARSLGSIAEMPLSVVQERLLDSLGWDPAAVQRAFGEDGPMSHTDLKNGLLYFALQVTRDRNKTLAARLDPGGTVAGRNESFWNAYNEEAIKILQSALTGRGKDAGEIVDLIKGEFWERANAADASELGSEGYIGPYDGNIAFQSMASWIRMSKLAQNVQEDAVAALRPDVNRAFVAEYRDRIAADYSPNQVISATDLNTLRVAVPKAFTVKKGLLKRRGERVPKVTRTQLERLLDTLEAEQAVADLTDSRPPTEAVPAIRPHQVENRGEVAKAFALRQDTVDKLLDTPPEELAGPLPGDLSKKLVDMFGMTERDIKANPELAWQRAVEWWGQMYESAIARGEALDSVDHFAKVIESRYAGRTDTGADAEAFRHLRSALTHPYKASDKKMGPTAAALAVERDTALSEFVGDLGAYLEDPARSLTVVEGFDGLPLIETDMFRAGDALMIAKLAEEAPATLSAESLAILADPLSHPLEKVDALREAAALDPAFGTAVQRGRLAELPDLESSYGSAVKEVLGEELDATRDTVAQLTQRGVAAGDTLDDLRERVRSLAGIIDRSPTRQLSGEVLEFYERGKVLGERKIGVGPQGATVANWRTVPLVPAGTVTALDEAVRSQAVAVASRRVADAEARLTRLDADVARITNRGDGALARDEINWPDAPIQKFATKKAAIEAAKLARAADGGIYGVTKVGSRFGLFRGELMDRPTAAAEPAAVPDAPVVDAEALAALDAPRPPETAPAAPIAPEVVAEAAPEPPPIVERITEAQNVREAQVEQLRRQAEANEEALAERTTAYQASRVEPGAAAAPVVDAPAATTGGDWGRIDNRTSFKTRKLASEASLRTAQATGHAVRVAGKAGDWFVEVENVSAARGGDAQAARQARRIAEGEPLIDAARRIAQQRKDDIAAVVAEGEQTREFTRQDGGRLIVSPDPRRPEGSWQVTQVMDDGELFGHMEADSYADAIKLVRDSHGIDWPTTLEADAPVAAAAPEVVFLDPADNRTPIRSRVVLVEADALLTSAEAGFPPNLQPRSRGVRASSDQQILEYAADIQPDKLVGTTEGASGMPVVSPDGAVVAGNGRTMALRLAAQEQYGRYKERLQTEALKHGIDAEQVNAMRRPMLVRELIDVDAATMERLAWQMNEMPVGDLAPSVAGAISSSDLRKFTVGEEQSLADAIRAPGNTEAVARMISRLPKDWHSRFFDPRSGLNEPGASLLEAVLISKLLRADDRAAPGFADARSVVFQITEQAGEDIKRISNGLAEATGQLLKAYADAENGAIAPDILTFGSDLAPALARIIALRDSGLTMDGVVRALDNVTAFDEFTLTTTQTSLAKLLASSTTQREVREFMRGVAETAGNSLNADSLFADVPQLDYTGLLNGGVRAWNAVRKANGRAEVDYFAGTDAPYDIPLGTAVSENVLGATEGPARMTQPLAESEVQAEIESRAGGKYLNQRPDDPILTTLVEGGLADSDTVLRAYADLADTFSRFDSKGKRDSFAMLLESANAAELTAGEALLFLDLTRIMGEPFVRRSADGRLNMRAVNAPDGPGAARRLEELVGGYRPALLAQQGWATVRIMEGHLRELEAMAPHTPVRLAGIADLQRSIESARAELTTGGFAEPDRGVRLIHDRPQRPISREQLTDIAGPDVPFDVSVRSVDEAIASAEHTIVVGDNPTVNRAIRRAVGAPAVEDGQRRIFEIHAPDAKVMAERLEAARQETRAEIEAARLAADEARNAPVVERTTDSVFPDPETRDMWDRLMRGSDVDQLAPAMGSVEPSTLAPIMDAVESIDKGVYADPTTGVGLTRAEGEQLRTHLMRLANANLEQAITRQGGARLGRATAKLGRPVDDFDVADLQDRAKEIMDELGAVVKIDPDAPLLERFRAVQYILAKPPVKAKPGEGPRTPRLLFRDRFAGDVVPGLLEELEVGRMEDVPRRVANSRIARMIDTIAGPRPEKTIRAQAISNFEAELTRYLDPDLADQVEIDRVHQVVEVAFSKWRDQLELSKVGRFQLYRRIHLMGPDALNKLFNAAVSEVYGGTTRPTWLADMQTAGKTPAQLWRRADNRIRQSLLKSGMPLGEAMEALYGRGADFGTGPATYSTVLYQTFRFLGDIRWLALEAIEPMMLTLPRGGLGPVLEASAARKVPGLLAATDKVGLTRSTAQPLAFGVEAQKLAIDNWAHWSTVMDIEQSTPVRQRYMIAELARDQQRPFRAAFKEMAEKEPGLRRMVDEFADGDVDKLLERLDRDWQLVERGTKEFGSQREAEAFFGRWLDDGIIGKADYAEFVAAKKYTDNPAMRAALDETIGDPATHALMERLAAINQDLFHNLQATFYGQENRSNIQRVVNHPLLFWPISYQIKATKWLARMMFEEFGGVDTGASVAGVFQRVHDDHRRRFASDPLYRAQFEKNRTLYFVAGMLLPIIPTELGVSMSPLTRMLLNGDYERSQGIMGIGPIYTNLSLIPRLIAEQTKQGGMFENLPAEPKDFIQRSFPQSITIGRPKPATSTIDVENERLVGQNPIPLPMEQLTTQRAP